MRPNSLIVACLFLSLAGGTSALAIQAGPQPESKQSTPTTPAPTGPVDPAAQAEADAWMKSIARNAHHKRLELLVGRWDATMKFWHGPDAPPTEEKGTMVSTFELNGLMLKSEFKSTMMGMSFAGTGYMGYDNNKKKYVGTWMDTMMSGMLIHEGDASADGTVITMAGSFVDPMGRTIKDRNVTTIIDENTNKFEMFHTGPDGAEKKIAEILYTRSAAAQPSTDTASSPRAEALHRQELPGGIIVEDLAYGEGLECPPKATITVQYRGMLKDGTEFDSSFKRGHPAVYPLNVFLKGWQAGIPGMKAGGKRRLTIPYPFAYGEGGNPPLGVPAKTDIVYEVELVSFTTE